jgi:hypothetical protein
MASDGGTQINRAGFASGGIAHRNQNVDLLIFEFIPGLADITFRRQAMARQGCQRIGVDSAKRVTASAIGFKTASAQVIK